MEPGGCTDEIGLRGPAGLFRDALYGAMAGCIIEQNGGNGVQAFRLRWSTFGAKQACDYSQYTRRNISAQHSGTRPLH
jgi:hypothetical protein